MVTRRVKKVNKDFGAFSLDAGERVARGLEGGYGAGKCFLTENSF
jgi:hypothetical protein